MKRGTIRKIFVPLMIALISTGCGIQNANVSQDSSVEETADTDLDNISLEEFRTQDFAALYEKAGKDIVSEYEGEWERANVTKENSGNLKIVNEDSGFRFEGIFLHTNPIADPKVPHIGQYAGKAVFVAKNIAIGKLDEKYTDEEDKYVGFFWDGDSMYIVQTDSNYSCMGNAVSSEGMYTRGE